MTDMRLLAAQTAMTQMFMKGHFSICTLDKVGELLSVNPKNNPEYTILHALHCIDFKDMPKPLRDELPKMIERCLAQDGLVVELRQWVIDVEMEVGDRQRSREVPTRRGFLSMLGIN